MAEGDDDAERSQEPTQKKLDDARKKGDVAKSQEVNTWFMLGAAALAMAAFAPWSASHLTASMRGILEHSHDIALDPASIVHLAKILMLAVAATLAMPLLLFMIAGFLGNVLQHGVLWTTEPITPKLSKISPLAGFKRIFSKQSLMNFVKGIFKIALVGAVLSAVIWPDREKFALTTLMSASQLAWLAHEFALMVLGATVAVITIVAAADWMFQYQTWYQKQRMSMRELKDEYKQQEGDPQIKAKIRQLRMERSRRRMMAQVPSATVVVTNPTHYAIALKYESGMPAPVCVAKGTDAVALKIREVATGANVPIVENPPLARALHASVELDEPIPTEHYRAVAEVIGYVYRLKKSSWRK